MTTVTQPTLFDIPQPPVLCHYCNGQLTELEALLPATCERSSVCTDCCTACHHQALGRMLRWWATVRPRGTRKRPGMTYPNGVTP